MCSPVPSDVTGTTHVPSGEHAHSVTLASLTQCLVHHSMASITATGRNKDQFPSDVTEEAHHRQVSIQSVTLVPLAQYLVHYSMR